ncbi:MAG: sporulation protein YabP [Firmicutes bacterium]|nr:sporulation protein YabP [Bacillota bacterium]
MDEKELSGAEAHVVTITNREQVSIAGVLHVDSFDDQEIVLDTELGTLNLKGEDLHIKQLNLDDGLLEIEGVVNSVTYSLRPKGRGPKPKGLLERILK